MYTCSGFVITALLVIHFFSDILRLSLGGYYTHATLSQLVESHSNKEYSWLLKLMANCFGYSCVFVPGYLIYKYVGRTKYLERSGKLIRFLKLLTQKLYYFLY